MNKTSTLTLLGAWIVLIVVISMSVSIWFKSAPILQENTNPDLEAVQIETISTEAILELNSLVKNGNLPLVVTPADLGRDNPFAAY